MPKSNERQHAIDLRQKGYSLALISEKTGVSRATLSNWLRDMPYEPNDETVGRMRKARAHSAKSRNQKRLERIAEGKKTVAADLLPGLTQKELMLFGAGLFFARGRGIRERLELHTSDAKLGRAFHIWLKKGLSIDPSHIFADLILFPSHTDSMCLEFWSATLSLPKTSMKISHIDSRNRPNQLRNPRFTRAPFGSVRIYLKNNGKKELGVLLFRKVEAMAEAIASMRLE